MSLYSEPLEVDRSRNVLLDLDWSGRDIALCRIPHPYGDTFLFRHLGSHHVGLVRSCLAAGGNVTFHEQGRCPWNHPPRA